MDQLEKRFGRFAIPGLIRVVVGFNALVFVLLQINPWFLTMIDLQPEAIMQGEVWRLFTYVFIPRTTSILWIVFALLFLWMMGEGVEAEWGAFKLNVFYLTGMLGCTVAAFFFGGTSMNFYLNFSLLFAFATLFPNYTIMLFLVLPVKVKWVAGVMAFFVVADFVSGPISTKMAIAVSLANYFLFFGPRFLAEVRATAATRERRRKFDAGKLSEDEPLHVCRECKRTDIGNPDLDFRVDEDGTDICSECLEKKARTL